MFLNNLKLAFRALLKNKTNTLINIIGLTFGIAAILLIYRMVNYELSFNTSFENYDRIVRVVSATQSMVEDNEDTRGLPIPAMAEMEQKVSQFEATSRVREVWGSINIRTAESTRPIEKIGLEDAELGFFVQPDFFQIFDLDWLSGNPKTALIEPGTIILTQKMAEKAFGRWEEAMDQVVYVDNLIPCKVTGVVGNLPSSTDFPFPYLISYETLRRNAEMYRYREESWGDCSSSNQFFALLKNKEDLAETDKVLASIGKEQYSRMNQSNPRQHFAQPLADLHYSDRFGTSGTHYTSKARLWVLGFIGLLILIMACFNFINLTTAQSILRAKEVGVRKNTG